MTELLTKPQRPLSPHLQIYKPQISSVLSILHRITGCFLSIGSLLLAYWLYTAAYNLDAYEDMNIFFRSIIGQILLVAWSGAFYYHLCNGIRHMFWDAGLGFSLPVMAKTGYAALAVAALLTAITWMSIWSAM